MTCETMHYSAPLNLSYILYHPYESYTKTVQKNMRNVLSPPPPIIPRLCHVSAQRHERGDEMLTAAILYLFVFALYPIYLQCHTRLAYLCEHRLTFPLSRGIRVYLRDLAAPRQE